MSQEPAQEPTEGDAKRKRKRGVRKGKPRPRPSAKNPRPETWHNRGRLALIELEPTVERMLVTGCSRATILTYCVTRGATDQQVTDLVKGIKARWAAVMDESRPQRIADFAAQLDAAIYDAWNRPVIVNTEEGPVPLRNSDGHAVTSADHSALAKYLKLKAELHGLNAPSKHLVLHGEAPSAAALTPVERQAEIAQLLARRAAALDAQAGRALPPPIDVEEEKSAALDRYR